jgi:hypothetical protein
LTLSFCFSLLSLFSFNFLLNLIELDLGIRRYVHELSFQIWTNWFTQRRKELLYLNISESIVLSILVVFHLVSCWFIFGLILLIPAAIVIVAISISSLYGLRKAIRDRPEVFSRFESW